MNLDLLTKDAQPHINITPLIDVLLVLLIIFMVVSPTKSSRFEAKIPAEPKIEDSTFQPDNLIVTIEKDFALKLNKESDLGTVDDAGKLSARLVETFRLRRENRVFQDDLISRNDLSDDEKTLKTVFIKAPRAVAYGDVVKVLDAVKGAGANVVGLQIDDLSD